MVICFTVSTQASCAVLYFYDPSAWFTFMVASVVLHPTLMSLALFSCCFFKLGGPLSLPWGLYVLICQRTPEKPCLNDVSDVGTWRRAALIASVFLVVLTLIPLWDELAEELGVGLVTSFWDTECLLIELGRDVAQFCIKISIRSAVKAYDIPIREYVMRLVQVGFARTVSHNLKASCEYAAATICDFEYDVWTNFVTIVKICGPDPHASQVLFACALLHYVESL